MTRVETRPNGSSPWTLLASNIVYKPLGPMKSADLGNGLKLALDWGTDRRLASKRLYTAAGSDIWHVSYGYDADDNIVAITDLVTPANSLAYGYDSGDRLTRVDGTVGAFARQDYLHDANGNRTTVERRTSIGDLTPAETDTYTKASGTNRLASVTTPAGTRSFTHDARGNLTGETLPGGGTVTLAYDGHGRLTSYAATGAPGQAMTYNGFDERIQMVTTPAGGGAADTRHFAYDQHHRLIGEYGATTADLRAEHIWLLPEVGGAAPFGGDDGLGGYMPLAVVVPAGGSTVIHWVQGNHLGTPVAVTDASGAVVTPSGYSMPGFPGQVRQHAELYYNYYRDYDVSLGRYVQADPIGLEGDVNPYSYALANPLRYTDPTGEVVPIILGFAIGAGIEYFTNDCASASDIILAGALGGIGGGFSKLALLRHGPRSLTRVMKKEWSHGIPRDGVDNLFPKSTWPRMNKMLNKRGGWNGSWVSPKRHYKHDPRRFPTAWDQMGNRLPRALQLMDRVPDWAKATLPSGGAGAALAGDGCGC